MPTYEYACRDCGEHVEVVQSFRDDALTICGLCGGRLRKVFSAAGIVFKGSGYYVNDSRKRPASDGEGSEGKKGDKGDKKEPVKTDAASADRGKADGGKTDGGKTDGGRTDRGRTDGGKTDRGRTDGGKTDRGRTDGGKTDRGKTAARKVQSTGSPSAESA